MIKFILFGCSFLMSFSLTISAQSLTRNEVVILGNTIETFFRSHDSIFTQEGETEFVQLILETDKFGIINKITVLGRGIDTLYKIFCLLKPIYFKDIQFVNSKEKLIVVPYFYFKRNRSNHNYADKLFFDYYVKIPLIDLINENGSIINIKWLSTNGPQKSIY